MKVDLALPDELRSPLYPNIGLAGLNLKNPLHSSIWDAFSTSSHSDNGPGRYVLVRDYNVFPKRSTDRGYPSKPPTTGILSRDWFHKHLTLVPAAVILFYELDWNDSHWAERQLDCGLQLNYLRSGLGDRATKLAVVLIQKNSLPQGEDALAMERATSLSSACELTSNSLFVLPVLHADHLVGYVIRLQNVFFEQASQYYLGETKRIKNNKDTLNRPNYQLLQARHLVKVSFFHEIRKDVPTALKHYNMSYSQLLEIKMSNKHQVKILCGFVNFKICQLSFRTGAPLDAIAQFERHVRHFKEPTEPPELVFMHWNWIANQFEFFGDLFNDAIAAGLNALQTKHPGFYYLQSAQCTMERRRASARFREEVLGQSVKMTEQPATKYYGQWGWEADHSSTSLSNGNTIDGDECILAMQSAELQVDYSRVIIPLLNKAVGQFKQYRPTRMKRFLMLEMGNEYFLAGDYEKAFSIGMCIVGEYRKERWWKLLSSVLELCRKSAFLVGNIPDYIAVCCELIGGNMDKTREEKLELQRNIEIIGEGNLPPGAPESIWQNRVAPEYTVEMTKLSPFLKCKAAFSASLFQVDEKIKFTLTLASTAVQPVIFQRVLVMFDDRRYNPLAVKEGGDDLSVVPGTSTVLSFEMDPFTDRESDGGGGVLRLSSVRLVLAGSHPISLQFSDIFPITKCTVAPRKANTPVTLSYHCPFLVGELQQVKVSLHNQEPCPIQGVILTVTAAQSGGGDGSPTPQVPEGGDTTVVMVDGGDVMLSKIGEEGLFERKLVFSLDSFEPGENVDTSFVLRCTSTITFNLSYTLSYSVTLGEGNKFSYPCESRDTFKLHSVLPFTETISLLSTRGDPISTLVTCDRCLIVTGLTAEHDTTIEISDIRYDIDQARFIDDETQSGKHYSLSRHNILNDCISIQPKASSQWAAIGTLSMVWKRKGSVQEYTTTHVSLPTVPVVALPVFLSCTMPSCGGVFSPIAVQIGIVNISSYVQEVDLIAEQGESFMLAGHKHLRCKILPQDKEFLQYHLVPLKHGLLSVPLPSVKLLRHPDIESAVITNKLIKSVFIKPRQFNSS